MTNDKVRQSAREFLEGWRKARSWTSSHGYGRAEMIEFAEAYAAADRELREQMSKTRDDVLKLWNDRAEADTKVRKLTDALRRIEQCTIPWIKRIAREALAEAGVKT